MSRIWINDTASSMHLPKNDKDGLVVGCRNQNYQSKYQAVLQKAKLLNALNT